MVKPLEIKKAILLIEYNIVCLAFRVNIIRDDHLLRARINSIVEFVLAAEKKDSKNGAARNFFGPSYFDPTLALN